MFHTFFSFSLLFALSHFVLAQSPFSIDTPVLVQCQPAQITWSDTGNPPYDLLVGSAQDECGDALEDLGSQTSTSLNWTVNLASGTQVVLYIQDARGNDAWSGYITIGASNNISCLASTPPAGKPTSPSGGGTSHTSSSSPTSTTFAPAGAAGAGVVSANGAFSIRPLTAITLLVSALFPAVAFAL